MNRKKKEIFKQKKEYGIIIMSFKKVHDDILKDYPNAFMFNDIDTKTLLLLHNYNLLLNIIKEARHNG